MCCIDCVLCVFSIIISLHCFDTVVGYGDSAGNTIEENSIVFCLI